RHTRPLLLPYTTLFRSTDEPVSLEQHRIELRRNHHETPIGRRVRTGQGRAELHEKFVSVRVRPRYGSGPQVITGTRDHETANELDRKSTRLNSSHVSIS